MTPKSSARHFRYNSIRVEASDIVTNMPSELMIVIPELAAGTYQIEVITQYSVGAILKEPRTAVF